MGDQRQTTERNHADQPPRHLAICRLMHIGLFSPAWRHKGEANGIVTYVGIVREELLRQGHLVTVFCCLGEDNPVERIYRINVPQKSALWEGIKRRIGIHRRPGHFDYGQAIAKTVTDVHAREPIDVFEMEESFGWCADVARALPLPLVAKLHGPAFLSLIDSEQESPERRLRITLEGDGLRAADLIVAPSLTTLRETAARYSLASPKLAMVPNPMSVVDDSLLWRRDHRWANDILYVGRFDYRKGGEAVLQAFARLARSRPALRLIFVGPDAGLSIRPGQIQHLPEYLALHLEPSIAARVDFRGSLPPEEIQVLRTQCALTVVASRWESFGYVVAEAMMQACPIVAFDVQGVNELIVDGESGLLVPLDDHDGLAIQVARLLDDPQRAASLGARARIAVIECCGAEAVVTQMLASYAALVNQHGRESPA